MDRPMGMNPFANLQRFDELVRRLGSEVDLTDQDVIQALIDGETNLSEICDALLEDIEEAEVHVIGLTDRIKAYEKRREMFKRQQKAARQFIFDVVSRTPEKRIKTTIATCSRKKGAKKLDIYNPEAVPFDYMVPQDPTPDRDRITADLKEDKEIAGCKLVDGEPSLQIRY